MLAQASRYFAPSGQRDKGDPIVVQWVRPLECFFGPGPQLDVVPFQRDASGDDRAHAGPADEIELDASFAQRSDNPDMSVSAGTTARQRNADGATDQIPREPTHVVLVAASDMTMKADT